MIQETKPGRIVCYNHPDRETTLRCNRCERPICADCAVLTPTGYRCKECVRGQQKVFDTARWIDYPVAFIIAIVLSAVGLLLLQLVAGFLGGIFLIMIVLFLSPVIGMIISEAVRGAVQRRRSKRLFQLTALATVLGALPFLLGPLLGLFIGRSGLGSIFSLILPVAYIFLVASSVYYRLSGIQIR
jgi:hypothetical protein